MGRRGDEQQPEWSRVFDTMDLQWERFRLLWEMMEVGVTVIA